MPDSDGLLAGLGSLPPVEHHIEAAKLYARVEAQLGRAEAQRIMTQVSAGQPGRWQSDATDLLLPGYACWLEREKAKNPNVPPKTVMLQLAEHVHKQAPGRYGNSPVAIRQALYRRYKQTPTAVD